MIELTERWIQGRWTSMNLHRGDRINLVSRNHPTSIRTYHFLLIILMMVKIINNTKQAMLMIPKIIVSSQINQLEGRKARILKIKGSK